MKWYYWLIVIGFLVVIYALLVARQKKQEKQSREILESFQVGDRVVTHIGVYGRIKKIYDTTYGKVCLLEIGTNEKVEVEMDMRYIAAKDEKTLVPTVEQKTTPIEDKPLEAEQETNKDSAEPAKEDKKENNKQNKNKSKK